MEKITSMIEFKGDLYVAKGDMIYILARDEFIPIPFIESQIAPLPDKP